MIEVATERRLACQALNVEQGRSSRMPYLVMVASAVLISFAFAAFLLANDLPVAWLLLPLAVGAVNLAFIARSRRHASRAVRGEATGRQLTPPPPPAPGLAAPTEMQWIGGANVPGAFGRANATWPLGVLEIAPGQVALRTRPGFLSRMFGTKPFEANVGEAIEIFPVRGRFRALGIGLQRPGEPVHYFWVIGSREQVLQSLAHAGFAVSWAELRVRF